VPNFVVECLVVEKCFLQPLWKDEILKGLKLGAIELRAIIPTLQVTNALASLTGFKALSRAT